jgi:hypothetical protein
MIPFYVRRARQDAHAFFILELIADFSFYSGRANFAMSISRFSILLLINDGPT